MNSNKDLKVKEHIVSKKQMALDVKMFSYDIWGTKAHVLMLHRTGVLCQNEVIQVIKALNSIENMCKKGKINIDPNKGAQLTLEGMIISKCGGVGYKIHTARSRNDQVMVTEMLYMKERVIEVMYKLHGIQKILLKLSKKHALTVMPGYTHMQPAKPTTFGQWCLAYHDSFSRGLQSLQKAFDKFDMNPLGAVESYGTSWKIDRHFTTKLLGFKKTWEIPTDVISSRGMAQLECLKAFSEVAITASKMAQDLLLFNTWEYGMIKLGDKVAQRMHPITGSSVMAQKKNPDVLELIRSTAPQINGFQNIVANLLSSLPMGYNRDTRETKEYMELGLIKINLMLDSTKEVLFSSIIDKKRMEKLVIENYSLTTDLADYIAQKSNIGYRLVYQLVGNVVDSLINSGNKLSDLKAIDLVEAGKTLGVTINLSDEQLKKALDPIQCISNRTHFGGSSSDNMKKTIETREKELTKSKEWIVNKESTMIQAKISTDEMTSKLIT